ncbi:MAG: zinc-binding protein [Firmicutes bacterium]|nr:zinc-binding protein [Bacillota bacterium]
MFVDKNLKCCDCGTEFLFSASEQEFFSEKGFTNPKRCQQCRANLKGRSNKRNSRGGSRQKRQMYSAICAGCGVEARVPVKPSEDQPLYCVDCYAKRSKNEVDSK